MKAWIIDRHGDPSVFKETEIEKPAIRAGHVLIEVAATSVNPIDTKLRQNPAPFAPALPAVLHGDVAGIVVAVGEGVGTFKPGDAVFGCAGGVKGQGGALADFMLADARLLAPKPQSLSMAEAAALPLVAITAWEGLMDRANLRAGQSALMHGAGGGVGHVAAQIAKAAGAAVVGTGSRPETLAAIGGLGVTAADYKAMSGADLVKAHTGGRGFDVVFDVTGGDALAATAEAVRSTGQVVSIAGFGRVNLTGLFVKGVSVHFVFMIIPMLSGQGRERHGEILRMVGRLADDGRLKPLLDSEGFTFAQVADAHRRLESGQAVGKVVLTR
jgi:NADPH2:quinone reductase